MKREREIESEREKEREREREREKERGWEERERERKCTRREVKCVWISLAIPTETHSKACITRAPATNKPITGCMQLDKDHLHTSSHH